MVFGPSLQQIRARWELRNLSWCSKPSILIALEHNSTKKFRRQPPKIMKILLGFCAFWTGPVLANVGPHASQSSGAIQCTFKHSHNTPNPNHNYVLIIIVWQFPSLSNHILSLIHTARAGMGISLKVGVANMYEVPFMSKFTFFSPPLSDI